MKILIILPTYNEKENIDKILSSLLKYNFLDVLVVDDNSTDGTKEKVETIIKKNGRVNLIERPAKLGLGTAYITGFKWGLERDYELFFEIDADLSHDPEEIPNFIKKIEKGYDVVIGSRYLNGTISVVGWDFKRLLLSKFGNFYASVLLNLRQFTDLTSGYRCYTQKALKKINLDKINSNGYAFQIEIIFHAYKNGLKISEIPIIFYEREHGGSKMSKKIIREAVLLPFKLHFLKFKTEVKF
jgi:dolichol-phosphate mannosyltransferase